MKGRHLALCFEQFGRCGEAFADRLAIDFPGQTIVGAVAGLAGLMTMAVRFSAGAADSGGATAEIAEFENLGQNSGPLLFECGKRYGQRAPPLLTYHYVRISRHKKETTPVPTLMSHTLTALVLSSALFLMLGGFFVPRPWVN